MVFNEKNVVQDLALAYADSTGSNYVLAQDPDSDRFSAAEKRYATAHINPSSLCLMDLAMGNGHASQETNSEQCSLVVHSRPIKHQGNRWISWQW